MYIDGAVALNSPQGKSISLIFIESDEEEEAYIYDRQNEISKITRVLEELNITLKNKSQDFSI